MPSTFNSVQTLMDLAKDVSSKIDGTKITLECSIDGLDQIERETIFVEPEDKTFEEEKQKAMNRVYYKMIRRVYRAKGVEMTEKLAIEIFKPFARTSNKTDASSHIFKYYFNDEGLEVFHTCFTHKGGVVFHDIPREWASPIISKYNFEKLEY